MSTAAPPPPAPRLDVVRPFERASDAEREETVARLHGALGEGRLDLAETEQRVTAAYAAQHRHELDPLVADLPTGPAGPSVAPEARAIWNAVVWRARLLVWGPAAAAPTERQCRLAAWVALVLVAWVLACALLGAVIA